MQKVGFGAQGYAANFCLSVFDRDYKVRSGTFRVQQIRKKGLSIHSPLSVRPRRVVCAQKKWVASLTEVRFSGAVQLTNLHDVLALQEGCSLEEGMALIKKAIHELSVRFLISQPKFIIKVGPIVKT